MRVGFTCSCFDLLHAGHIIMLEDAKKQCDKLIVGLQVDPTVRKGKNKPIQDLGERAVQLKAVKHVDEVVLYETEEDLVQLLKEIKPDVRILGSDYIDKSFTGDDLDIEIYYHKRAHSFSTSNLRKLIYEEENKKMSTYDLPDEILDLYQNKKDKTFTKKEFVTLPMGGDFKKHKTAMKTYIKAVSPFFDPEKVCLDVGSGNGDLTKRLSNEFKIVISMDFFSSMKFDWLNNPHYAFNKNIHYIELREGEDYTCPTIRNGSIDFIHCMGVFHFLSLSTAIKYLKNMYRVLKVGGTIFLSVPGGKQINPTTEKTLGTPGEWFTYSDDDINKIAKKLNFTCKIHKYEKFTRNDKIVTLYKGENLHEH